jgi:hypothetical protein
MNPAERWCRTLVVTQMKPMKAKEKTKQIPKVEVAVALIACGDKILAVHNPKWRAFSVPMTKPRRWEDPAFRLGLRQEDWQAAAVRAAAEALGRTLAEPEFPLPLHEIQEFRQNDEEGIWKLYHLHLFKLPLAKMPSALGFGVTAEWLTADQLQERAPVSSTVRYLLKQLASANKLPPWS